jgi:molybdopterin/thiamine biosynthesis adenylyltransferase
MTSLKDKSVLALGADGIGCAALAVLGAGGVGRLLVADDGVVGKGQLDRAALFREEDVGLSRAHAASRQLLRLHPELLVEPVDCPRTLEGVRGLVKRADVVVNVTGDVETMFLANDAAVSAGIPCVLAGILQFSAHVLTVIPGMTGCLRCLYEDPPPAGVTPGVADAGVLGALATFVGGLVGAEATRLLQGELSQHSGRLLLYEARAARERTVLVRRRDTCPCSASTPPTTEMAS